jgi:hypothetical protein
MGAMKIYNISLIRIFTTNPPYNEYILIKIYNTKKRYIETN